MNTDRDTNRGLLYDILKRRGKVRLNKIIEKLGGTLTEVEVSALLNISSDDLHKMDDSGLLISINRDIHEYPAFQFDVPFLKPILIELGTDCNIAKIRFLIGIDPVSNLPRYMALKNKDNYTRILEQASIFEQHIAS